MKSGESMAKKDVENVKKNDTKKAEKENVKKSNTNKVEEEPVKKKKTSKKKEEFEQIQFEQINEESIAENKETEEKPKIKEEPNEENSTDKKIKSIVEKAKTKGTMTYGELASELDSYKDHRLAMSFAVLAKAANLALNIKNKECVDISFPEFWKYIEL